MTALKTVTTAVRTVTMLLNGTLMLSPWMLAIAGIAALVMGYSSLTSSINSTTGAINGVTEAEEKRQEAFANGKVENDNPAMTNKQVETAKRLREAADNSNLVTSIVTNTPAVLYEIGTTAYNFLDRVGIAINNVIGLTKFYSNLSAHANGTQYHTGGVALVGERGPELVNLPRGSSVTTAERTRSMSGANTFNISVNVTGAEKSDEEIAEAVARKIVEAVDNAW